MWGREEGEGEEESAMEEEAPDFKHLLSATQVSIGRSHYDLKVRG